MRVAQAQSERDNTHCAAEAAAVASGLAASGAAQCEHPLLERLQRTRLVHDRLLRWLRRVLPPQLGERSRRVQRRDQRVRPRAAIPARLCVDRGGKAPATLATAAGAADATDATDAAAPTCTATTAAPAIAKAAACAATATAAAALAAATTATVDSVWI